MSTPERLNPQLQRIPNSWVMDEIVTLRVGAQQLPFHVHKTLLAKSSPFFKHQFGDDRKGSRERVIFLHEDPVLVVKSWVLWLYHKHFYAPEPSDDKSDAVLQPFLCQSYAFGDKMRDLDFKDAVIDAYISRCRQLYTTSFSMIRATYQHSTMSSPARQLHVDLALSPSFWKEDLYEKAKLRMIMKDLPQDFQVDLMAGLVAKGRQDVEDIKLCGMDEMCAYHEHRQHGGRCYKKKKLSEDS